MFLINNRKCTVTIPYTKGRYTITSSGETFDKVNGTLLDVGIGDMLTLELSGITVTKPFEWFWVLSVCPPNLHVSEVIRLHVERIPGRLEDRPTSFMWVYTRPVPLCENSEWFHIPGATKYLVNRHGDVKSLYSKTDKYDKDPCKEKEGHLSTTLVTDSGLVKNQGIHRLVCGTFNGYPLNVFELHCNHIDSDPSNNVPTNVEFVTPAMNSLHGLLVGNKVNVNNIANALYKGVHTKAVKFSKLDIPFTPEEIWQHYVGAKVIDGLSLTVSYNGLVIHNNGDRLASIAKKENIPCFILNLKTGLVTKCESIGEAARFCKTTQSNLSIALKSVNKVVKNIYSVSLDGNFIIRDKAFIANGKFSKNKTVLVKDIVTGKVSEIKGLLNARKVMSDRIGKVISKKVFTKDMAAKRQRLWFDRYLFKYDMSDEPWIN